MGNWQLETFRMTIYMAFPVFCFWIFNQPSYVESFMLKKIEELYPKGCIQDPADKKELMRKVALLKKNRQAELDAEYDKY